MSGRRKRALGKGLGEIFPGIEEEVNSGTSGSVDVDLIDPNPYQPRSEWSREDISSLAASIRAQGILQPLVLRRHGRRYQLIAGERRLRAAREVGLERVPAVIRDADDRQMLALALMENLQRRDLGPLEKAEAFRRLSDEFGLTQEQMAVQVGMSRSAVANFQRLLDLPDKVKELLGSGKLQMGHGRALLSLGDPGAIERMAIKAANRGYSVRQLEDRVRRRGASKGTAGKKRNKRKDPDVRQLEEELQRIFMTRVRIGGGGDPSEGSISIAYHSLEELDRILDIIRKTPEGKRNG